MNAISPNSTWSGRLRRGSPGAIPLDPATRFLTARTTPGTGSASNPVSPGQEGRPWAGLGQPTPALRPSESNGPRETREIPPPMGRTPSHFRP